jgi:hypothetical protein
MVVAGVVGCVFYIKKVRDYLAKLGRKVLRRD